MKKTHKKKQHSIKCAKNPGIEKFYLSLSLSLTHTHIMTKKKKKKA